jgi:hypothetical protein
LQRLPPATFKMPKQRKRWPRSRIAGFPGGLRRTFV